MRPTKTKERVIGLILLLINLLYACIGSKPQQKPIPQKIYGITEYINDSLSVELNLNEFDHFDSLVKRVDQITCYDSVPKISFLYQDTLRSLYLANYCNDDTYCYRNRDVIYIYPDSITKYNYGAFPYDSLERLIRKDYENYDRDMRFAVSPFKMHMRLTDFHQPKKTLPPVLSKIFKAYKSVTGKSNMAIILYEVPSFDPKTDKVPLEEDIEAEIDSLF
ncbi:hypothetical protein FUAX_46410 (plasmid) [Fulvitalea axinellae]|uniref:Lipoprotein n=1 Tax=Fulvitalea axinellae TaxID=1182444 RepID=A0AAU9CJB3_9BACT|nr:hypothetical protein FUAX_46410 [Fulvitalea axinellae]